MYFLRPCKAIYLGLNILGLIFEGNYGGAGKGISTLNGGRCTEV